MPVDFSTEIRTIQPQRVGKEHKPCKGRGEPNTMKQLLINLVFVLSVQLLIAGSALGSTMNCFDCHKNAGNIHHENVNAAVGNCEYCHPDPRPAQTWQGPFPGDNGYNTCSKVPTQLSCRECHVSFSNGTMIVTKFSRTDYTKYTQDYTKQIVHTIPNSQGRINNYGICLGCHNGTTATAVTVWHARPDKHAPQSWVYGKDDGERCTGYRERWDETTPVPKQYAHYLPGRSSGTIGGFNLFNAPGFGYRPNPNWDWDACGDAEQYQTSALDFTRITVPAALGQGPAAVPVFPSLLRMTPDGLEGPCEPKGSFTFTFNSTGSVQSLDIPVNAQNIQFTVKGAGGGGGRPDNAGLQASGQPGSKVVMPAAAAGMTLKIYVAGGGKMGSETSTGAAGGWGYPSGGKGGNGDDDGDGWAFGGAGGGGASSIYNGTTRLAEAKGGAGGRSDDWYDYWDYAGGSGGAGGGSNYYPSGTVALTGGGTGGTTAPTSGGNGQVVITYEVPW